MTSRRPTAQDYALWLCGSLLFWAGFVLCFTDPVLGGIPCGVGLAMVHMGIRSLGLPTLRELCRPIRPQQSEGVRQQQGIQRYRTLAHTYDELDEPEMAADFRAWAAVFTLIAEAERGLVGDHDPTSVPEHPRHVSGPQASAQGRQQTIAGLGVPSAVIRGSKIFVPDPPQLIPNFEGGAALGTCSGCGMTIYGLGPGMPHRIWRGTFSCPGNPAWRLVRWFTI